MEAFDQLLGLAEPWQQGSHTLESILLSLLLAFVLGQFMAWIYYWTHNGLSYSRSFTQSLILITMIVAMVMIVVDNSLITAFGLIGALAIIRFRNVLKDTRDTAFVFTCIVLGMGAGSQRYMASIVGACALAAAILYVSLTGFGSRGRYDGFLRCRLPIDPELHSPVLETLQRHCRRFRQVSRRQSAREPRMELTYQVILRDALRPNDLVAELEVLPQVDAVTLVLQDEMAEV
jgi:hypothetical protein